jgi:hypothetical protein
VKGFLLGLALGLLALGATLLVERRLRTGDPCLERCGAGTRCLDAICRVMPTEAARKAPRKHRARGHVRRGDGDSGLRKPSAADLAPVADGPTLGATDRVDLTRADRPQHELTTDEVTRRFRALDERIVGCIDRARGDYLVDRGEVIVGFRVEASGRVEKVRVSAPALLQRVGLSGCVRPLVASLRFPASAAALIMKFPFTLR